MAKDEGRVSIIVMPDGGGASRQFTFSRRLVRASKLLGPPLCVIAIAMAITWPLLLRRVVIGNELARQADSLQTRYGRMETLAQQLADLEGRYDNLRRLLGLSASPDSALWLPRTDRAADGSGRLPAGETATEPTAWPLTVSAFVTQSLLDGAQGDHPGIDIAVPGGSYVRAAGGGEVIAAADDPIYGLFVLIDHGNGLWSRYGHASYLAVERGQRVRRAEVIALSGSTGRSTAPHLHFEILRNGRPVDPLSMVTPP